MSGTYQRPSGDTQGPIAKFYFRVSGKVPFFINLEKLTLARISHKDVYLNLFGGGHFH